MKEMTPARPALPISAAYNLGRAALPDNYFFKSNPENDPRFVTLAEGFAGGNRERLAGAWKNGLAVESRIQDAIEERLDV